MKNVTMLGLVLISLMAASCATRVRVMDATAVSMTESSLAKNMKLTEIGPVEDTFCPDASKDSGTVGLMDEAIRSAQKKSGADFITNATFYREMSGCIVVSGTANKKGK